MSNTTDSQIPVRKAVPNFARIAAYAVFPIAFVVSAFAAANRPRPAGDAGTPIPRVTITARDFAYDMADTIAAGYTEFVLKNLGPEMHHVQFLRLEGGHTLGNLMNEMKHGAPPKWAVEAGGPNAPAPGAESRGIVNLRAGRYALVCLIPSTDGMPHVMKGMAKELIVRPNSRVAAAPSADLKITLSDYAFAVSKPLTAGKHMIAITNAASAPQAHEMVIVKFAPGKTLQDGMAWMEKQDGPSPLMPIGGTVGLKAGDTMYVPVELTAGEYALLCFLPDHRDGKPHVEHGMLLPFSVK